MDTPRKTRVMVVDGTPLCRVGILRVLSEDDSLEICAEAGEAPEARRLCAETRPDIIVLDVVSVERGDGLGLIRDFARLHRAAGVLVIAPGEDAHSLQVAFEAGARGYVSRQDHAGQVLAGMKALRSGLRFASRRVAHLLLEHLATGKLGARVDAAGNFTSALSAREMEIFRLIGAGLGCTAIARELGLSVKTVETHRGRMKEKLHLASGEELNRRAAQWTVSTAELLPPAVLKRPG